jgi:predicted transcriptional regulator of viral defense system
MQTITEMALQRAVRGIFTREEAACWVDDRGQRLDGLLKRAVSSGEVLRIRRGLFCLSRRYPRRPIETRELAQRIHGPSYISFESALSYHEWIPEAVYTITSASMGRSRTLETPVGVFSFTRVPQRHLLAGVTREIGEDGGSFFVATPLKALADYVYAHGHTWTSVAPVEESLRVETSALASLPKESFDSLTDTYRSGRVKRFLEGLQKDLHE